MHLHTTALQVESAESGRPDTDSRLDDRSESLKRSLYQTARRRMFGRIASNHCFGKKTTVNQSFADKMAADVRRTRKRVITAFRKGHLSAHRNDIPS